MAPKEYPLGFGYGSLLFRCEDSILAYRPTAKIIPAFQVKIDDISSIVSQTSSISHELVKIYGQGTLITSFEAIHGTSERIRNKIKQIMEEKNKSKIDAKIAEKCEYDIKELDKIIDHYKNGYLTEEEFILAKSNLLGKKSDNTKLCKTCNKNVTPDFHGLCPLCENEL